MHLCVAAILLSLAVAATIDPLPTVAESDLAALLSLSAGIFPKDPTWSNNTPACHWRGVACNTTDSASDEGPVVSIDFGGMSLSGNVNMTRLPRKLQALRLSNAMSAAVAGTGGFTGCPDFSHFPDTLSYVDLSGNKFHGKLGISSSCCKGLTELFAHYNLFSSVNAADLPPSLRVLTLFGSNLTGTALGTELSSLPRNMIRLDVAWNHGLSGLVDLSNLPQTMQVLNLYGCAFGGRLDLSNLPLNLQLLGLDDNRGGFCGSGIIFPAAACSAVYMGAACSVNCSTSRYSCRKC